MLTTADFKVGRLVTVSHIKPTTFSLIYEVIDFNASGMWKLWQPMHGIMFWYFPHNLVDVSKIEMPK